MKNISIYRTKLLICYLMLSALFAVTLYVVLGIHNEWLLANNPTTVMGEVVETVCDQHLEFRYLFTLEGEEFHGTGQTHFTQICAGLKPHSKVLIYFLKNAPRVSTTSDPTEQLIGNVIPMVAAALVFPFFIIWRVVKKSRRNETAETLNR